jgi:hypothetical protein
MNTKKLCLVSLLTMAVLLLSACSTTRGSGNLITESRNVSDFERVDLSGSGEVIIIQGEEESLTVETDDNVMPYVTTNVRKGTLYLSMNPGPNNYAAPTRLRFTLQVKNLTGLDVSGSGSIAVETLATDRLDSDISGSGSIEIDELTADQLNVDISGSGNLQVAGNVAHATLNVGGSSRVRAEDLRGGVIEIQADGSSATTVWAIEALDVALGGSSSVRYYGDPALTSSTSGSSTIKSLGAK